MGPCGLDRCLKAAVARFGSRSRRTRRLQPPSWVGTAGSGVWLRNQDQDQQFSRLLVCVESQLKVGACGRRFVFAWPRGTLGLRVKPDQSELDRELPNPLSLPSLSLTLSLYLSSLLLLLAEPDAGGRGQQGPRPRNGSAGLVAVVSVKFSLFQSIK